MLTISPSVQTPASASVIRRLLAVLVGVAAGSALGSFLGAVSWGTAKYLLMVPEELDNSLVGGVMLAIAGLALVPLTGAILGGFGGASVGLLLGISARRKSGLVLAVAGLIGGASAGIIQGVVEGSSARGADYALCWGLFGSVVGAMAHLVLARNFFQHPGWFGAAVGWLGGMALIGAMGPVFMKSASDNSATLLALWTGFPAVCALGGAILHTLTCRDVSARNSGSVPAEPFME